MISIITFILLAFLRLLSTQETGSYEVRELSLSRPYPTGINQIKFDLHIDSSIDSFSFCHE